MKIKPTMQNKAKTKTQMANEYGVCLKTFNRWLKRENILLPKGLICPKDQQVIYELLGCPKMSD